MTFLKSMAIMLNSARRLFSVARIFDSATEAISDISSGSSIAIGGYMTAGVPENLIKALKLYGNYDFTAVALGSSVEDYGVNALIKNKQIKRLITPFLWSREANRQYHNGELELELIPGGTLAEKIRAAGAGIPGFWTTTGVGTIIEEGGFPIKYKKGGVGILIHSEGKESRIFSNQKHIYETGMRTEYSLVKAWKADTLGNLVYRRTARNFNPEIAICSKYTIAEVEEIVPLGEINPDEIDTPGIFVKRIIKGENYTKPNYSPHMENETGLPFSSEDLAKAKFIAKRVAKELKPGMYVKVDTGIPVMVSEFVKEGVTLATASGIIGLKLDGEQADPDCIYAYGQPAWIQKGGAVVSSNMIMDLLRGGHFDAAVLRAYQVSGKGDLAGWMIPGQHSKGIGGTMDSVANRKQKIIVAMNHTDDGRPRIISECTLPLTGRNCVDLVVTELGVFDFREEGLNLKEMAKGVTFEEIRSKTGCGFTISSDIKSMD